MESGITGIYKITNKINGKIYIGQSVDIRRRWYEHKGKLGKPGAEEYYFQKALKKYGIDNFTWEILEECEPDQLNEREQYYISLYRTYVGFDDCNGYNLTRGGDAPSVEARCILQYDKAGHFIAKYKNIDEAVKKTGIKKSSIYAACNKTANSAKDYQFTYEGDPPPGKYYPYFLIQINPKTGFIEYYDNLKEASIKTGILDHAISCCYAGKTKTAGGYQWLRIPCKGNFTAKFMQQINNK